MENGHDEIEDDIFDHHMNEIDERETPRWEMSEEDPDPEEEQSRLLNCTQPPKQQAKQSASVNSNKKTEIVQNGQTWDDVSERDSVKDFSGPYREQEEKYMKRSNEAIFNRASEEHIRQPIPYDDVDSVKNFGGASQGMSRIPSEEELCLSPPWPLGYEVDDGVALEDNKYALEESKVPEVAATEANGYRVDDVVSQAKLRADSGIGATSWQGEDKPLDFTRNYAEEGSLEHSRRPSSEDISLTPPWLDTDKESSCKDIEEQILDDSELLSPDPPTTSSNLTSTPTTTHIPPPKIDPLLSTSTLPTANKILSVTLPENLASQNPHAPIRTPSIQPDPISVPSSMSELPRPPQRRALPGKSADRNNVRGVNPAVASLPPRMRTYGNLYANEYPSSHKAYPGNQPYGLNDPYMRDPYTANKPYANRLPNTHMPYPAPRPDFMQQPNLKSYNGIPFNPRQFRPNNMSIRAQGASNRSQINPTNPSYSSIPRPYPNGYYDPVRIPQGPRVAPPRQAINGYDAPYYGQQLGRWQYQVKHPQMPIEVQSQPPPISAADFADDEVINFAAGAQRTVTERPRVGPTPDIHRGIATAPEHQRGIPAPEVHRNIPVSEIQRGVPKFRRDIAPAPDNRRGIPTHEHQRAVPEHQIDFDIENNIPEIGLYSDFPDDITTVSDSDVSPVMSTRSESHSSLAVYCPTPHRDGGETASVMSFVSGASTSQDLDSKIDHVRNILAVIDTRDAKETAQTLYSLSNSKEHCQAMRLSGCLPLLIQLQHRSKPQNPRVGHEVRVRSARAMRNIIAAGVDDKRGKRERYVLKWIEIVRSYCIEVRYVRSVPNSTKLRSLDTALAALMKLSFEEEHRAAIGDLGGVEAIGEFLELSYANKEGELSLGSSVRKYASMTLTNMTFEKTRSKALLGNSSGIVKALLKNLNVLDDEDLIQVSASVLRNLSCKSDERSKVVLQECNAVSALITAAQKISGESTLRTILYAIWNLSAHSSQNKVQICETHKALGFLVEMLAYKSPSNSLSVVESSGGILRNLSSQIAVKSEYRATLREHECFKMLLANLRSPSLRVVGNACGILWNLSARCEQDQDMLLKMGAPALLKPLVTSKNKSISKGAGAAIKNLQNYKTSNPGRDSPSETRKHNGILRQENGSPSQTRAKGRSRDAHSLNSFTGSADDMTKERQSSRTKENGETDSLGGRSKGVRWSDDKRTGKEPQRKTSNDRKRGDSSPDEQQTLVNGAQTSRDLGTRDGVKDVTSAVGQLQIGEKPRGKKSDVAYSSPRTKKKSSSKSKKHHSGGDVLGDETLRLSQESQLNRSMSSSRGQGSASARRHTSSDVQQSDGVERTLGKHSGKQTATKIKESKGGRKGTSGDREDDTRSNNSDDDVSRSSPKPGRNNVRSARKDSVEENDRDFNDDKGLVTRVVDLASQRCQCADETEVWVKRSKICNHCKKRRVSHSSDSTSGSRRSSSESLSSSNRQLNRKEPLANGTGYVTTI